MLEQFLGLAGALLVLIGYTLVVLKPDCTQPAYTVSLCGGLLLLWLASLYHNIGLVVLEVAWVAINAWGLMRQR
ncbi:MAG: hypothetical protein Q9M22_06450 [Mariprofundaceae bacterium]|nr:hypothetical protein [Mariprofundaceae bacterium]